MANQPKIKEYKESFQVPIYDVVVNVVVTNNLSEAWKVYEEPDGEEGDTLAIVLVNKDGEIVLILKTPVSISTLVHEINHIVCRVLLPKGYQLIEESEEAFCYLSGFIAEKVEDIIKNSKKKELKKKEIVKSITKPKKK